MNGPGIVEAGGIGPLPATADSDELTVRVYRHPGFGDDDRTVVRLVPSMLGEAEDLTMEFLGFSEPEHVAAVGVTGRQALGFPAWALVHDPANGRHALALVKEMRKLAKQAAAKPSTAMDGYRTLAGLLDGAAPQFLPTFWEEAGRALIAGENVRYAATCFNHAREAEQAHALAVDEDRVAEVFLEYAMAGALPVKAISQYARDLAARSKPDAAFERFRAVTLRRVASGLAPYAALPAELKRLATAAGLDADTAVEDVVVDLVGMAATARSAPGTWKALRPVLVRAAARRPEVRGRLLAVVPDPPGYGTDITDEWIDLLEAASADAGLVADVDPAQASPDGPAGWLERMSAARQRHWNTGRSHRLLALAERMVPALCAAGRPLRLLTGHHVDLDLLDVCLAGDVAVAPAGRGFDLNVARWLDDTGPGARPLSAVAADGRFAAALGVSATQSMHHTGLDRLPRLTTTPGLRTALAGWLRAHAATAPADPTLAGLTAHAGDVSWVSTVAAAAVEPDAVRRIAAVDPAAGLTRTLRTGLLAEFVWPVLEGARDDLPNSPAYSGSWPHLVAKGEKKAVVLGPSRVVLTHAYPKNTSDWWYREAVWIPGVDRLLLWSYHGMAYWADAPASQFEAGIESDGPVRALALPGGGATFGGAPWQPGDTGFPHAHPFISDGTRYWRRRQNRWWRYDPATGEVTAGDPPEFLADDSTAGDLVPAPAEWARSPLGYADGLVGWKVRGNPDGSRVGTRIDGVEVLFPASTLGHEVPVGGLLFPGADRPCPVLADSTGPTQRGFTVYTPGGDQKLTSGVPRAAVPPTDWWHAWQVRDAAGSAALRAVDGGTVREVLDAVVALQEAAEAARLRRRAGAAAGSGDDPSSGTSKGAAATLDAAVTAAVTAALPAITAPKLRKAVVAGFTDAGRLTLRLNRLRALADSPPEEQPVAAPTVTFDPQTLRTVLDDLDQPVWLNDADCVGLVAQLAAVPGLLAGDPPGRWPDTDVGWPELLVRQDRMVLRALTPGIPDAERETLFTLLGLLAGTGLAEADGTVRILRIDTGRKAGKRVYSVPQVVRTGDRTLLVQRRVDHSDHVYMAIEHDPGGQFGPVPHGTIVEETVVTWGGRQRVDTVVTALAGRGTPPWFPDAVTTLVADTGMSRGTAALVLAGGPHLRSDEANFLHRDTRTTLGISAVEARSGRSVLQSIDTGPRRRLILAAMPADPVDLWTTGPDVAAVAAVWREISGSRLVLPDDVLAEVNRLQRWGSLDRILMDLAGGAEWLRPERATAVGERVGELALILPWLVYRLPRESPVRAAVPGWYDQVRIQLADPAVTIDAGYLKEGTPLPPSLTARKAGYDGYVHCALRPAKLGGADDPVLRMFPDDTDVAGVRRLIDPGTEALMASVRADDGRTGWAQDPTTEVPDLVAEVAARHGLGTDAAAYYLQLLALGDPTDRNVRRWTGWSAARLSAARAELVAAGPVVEAKRAGAGRSVFLPGGWHRTPGVEEWKVDPADGTPSTAGLSAPCRPVAALFRAAWQRILDGDPPQLRSL